MKRSPVLLIRFLIVVAGVILACRFSSSSTDTPSSTSTPRRTSTPRATGANQTYTNLDYGVTVLYPPDWSAEATDQEGVLTYFVSPDQNVIAVLIANPMEATDTLESVAEVFSASTLESLQNIEVLSSSSIQLADGTPALTTVATGTRSDGVKLKINMTLAVKSQLAFAFLIFGPPSNYNAREEEITGLVQSLLIGESSLGDMPRDQSLVLLGSESTNSRDYDPVTTHGSGDKLVFSGLVSFDRQLNLVPELAETWEVKDGVVYTFHLRQSALFHNGRPVTAQDVVYSWERAASPATASDTVLTYLGDIVGVKEMYEGKADHISGLVVMDEHTLQVTIDAPKPYFLLKLTYPVGFVVDQENVESGSEWYRTPNGTGPYRLKQWVRFQKIVYERNQDFYLEPPVIPYVVVQLYSGVGERLYETGAIDITGVSVSNLQRMLDPEEPLHADLVSGVSLCTTYVAFDTTQPPFDDVKVRQAFTMAFDRQKFIDVVWQGNALPAEGLFPPALPGYNPILEGLPYDPERARQLLSESKYGSPEGLPSITYTDYGFGSMTNPDVAALAQMWQQNLGVTITIENLEPNRFYDMVYSGIHGQVFSSNWCADYPDPENFADVLFYTGAQQNLSGYSNPEVDRLLEQARVEQDVTRRIRLYQQAEQIIVEDAPVLFLVHPLVYVLVKPYIQGYVLTPIDIPLERYLWIEK
jgi:oligopeptide transport system substrate-binding protein